MPKNSGNSMAMLRALTNEVFILLLATLIFFTFVIPAMIKASASQHIPRKPSRTIWISVVDDGGTRPFFNKELGVCLYDDESNEFSNCFQPGETWVSWNRSAAPVYSLTLKKEFEGDLYLGAWWARIGDVTCLPRPVKLVIYSDAEAVEVRQELKDGTLNPGRTTLVLNPSNFHQAEILLPDYLKEKN